MGILSFVAGASCIRYGTFLLVFKYKYYRETFMAIHNLFAIALVTTLTLASCATSEGPLPLPSSGGVEQTAPPAGAQGDQDKTSGLNNQGRFQLNPLQDPNSPLAKRMIYFDYDSDQVKADSLATINAHGKYLARYPTQRVRLEGHADERGTREYNLALGERRAESVNRLLQLQGVLDDQIEIISYGEELPAASGHDERSWALNRRVEIVYGELYGER
jgi:peptidoglycan-associated lipoprotein